MRPRPVHAFASALLWALVVSTNAEQPARIAPASTAEAATARRFESVKNDPLKLRAFLNAMPKGGDLHNHLSGAVYAEHYIEWAAADGLCIATATMTIVTGTCDDKAGRPPASAVRQNAALFSEAIDAMSMRHWNPALNGHDHFFQAFARFGPASTKTGEMLAVVTSEAAAEHVSYLELMITPDGGAAAALGRTIEPAALPQWRERLLAAGLREKVVTAATERLDGAEARRRELLKCGTADAGPGCSVTIRYIAQVSRTAPPQVVFAQMVGWFELVGADPRVVSLNLVQPEDNPTAVHDFALQMSMLDFLHKRYPAVPITLHAGELVEGMVPPHALRSHVTDSVRIGHASRIGHGTSIMHEPDPIGLMREMARTNVLVEVTLTSNEQILGIKARHHPLRIYLEHDVPVALVTDDMGVARSSHTAEFVKAVEEHGVGYAALKRMVRNSIDYAFADRPTKARLRAELDRAFVAFER